MRASISARPPDAPRMHREALLPRVGPFLYLIDRLRRIALRRQRLQRSRRLVILIGENAVPRKRPDEDM